MKKNDQILSDTLEQVAQTLTRAISRGLVEFLHTEPPAPDLADLESILRDGITEIRNHGTGCVIRTFSPFKSDPDLLKVLDIIEGGTELSELHIHLEGDSDKIMVYVHKSQPDHSQIIDSTEILGFWVKN